MVWKLNSCWLLQRCIRGLSPHNPNDLIIFHVISIVFDQ